MGKEEKRVVLAAHEEAEQPAAEENTDWRNAGSIRDYLDAVSYTHLTLPTILRV